MRSEGVVEIWLPHDVTRAQKSFVKLGNALHVCALFMSKTLTVVFKFIGLIILLSIEKVMISFLMTIMIICFLLGSLFH